MCAVRKCGASPAFLWLCLHLCARARVLVGKLLCVRAHVQASWRVWAGRRESGWVGGRVGERAGEWAEGACVRARAQACGTTGLQGKCCAQITTQVLQSKRYKCWTHSAAWRVAPQAWSGCGCNRKRRLHVTKKVAHTCCHTDARLRYR